MIDSGRVGRAKAECCGRRWLWFRASRVMPSLLAVVVLSVVGLCGGGTAYGATTTIDKNFECTLEYSTIQVADSYAIGNCHKGEKLEGAGLVEPKISGDYRWIGGWVGGGFSGCGWIEAESYKLKELSSQPATICSNVRESSESPPYSEFIFKENGTYQIGAGSGGKDGVPVVNTVPCPEYANYRPWSTANAPREKLSEEVPAYAPVKAGSREPALLWRYVTKYQSTEGAKERYVMVYDQRYPIGKAHWVFVPKSCLPATLPQGAGEELPEKKKQEEEGEEVEGAGEGPHPTSIQTKNGELLVFEHNHSHELLSFVRGSAGGWTAYDLTSMAGGGYVTATAKPIQLSNGELIVFARATNNELISFVRGSTGGWTVYNETALAGGGYITATPVPIQLSNGELIVFAQATSTELISFVRGSAGGWTLYNETSMAGGGYIAATPAPIQLSSGELLVFARATDNELISFVRGSTGGWTVYNETSMSGGGYMTASPRPIQLSSGELLVFAQATDNELISFVRGSTGGWAVYNETSMSGGGYLNATPAPIQTSNGELLVFAHNLSNELVSFVRGSTGAWNVYDQTASAGGGYFTATPAPIQTSSGELLVFARATDDELVSFARGSTGGWSLYNLSALAGGVTI